MNVLLVYPPARDASMPPMGIAYIAAALRRKGHEVAVLDLTAAPLDEKELEAAVDSLSGYDCVGISAIITAYGFVKSFSRLVKSRFPEIPVIVGNAISVACPEVLMKNAAVDAVVVDEGELTTEELVENIRDRKKWRRIKGIWYRGADGAVRKTPSRERIRDIDSLPRPAWDLIDIPEYIKNAGPYMTWGLKTGWVSCVRGCPFGCGYCSRSFGRTVTHRSPDKAIDEMLDFAAKYGAGHFKIVDDLMMANTQFVKDFSAAMIARKVKLTWQCSGRVNLVNGDLLKLMKRANCICIGYGIESGSQKILDNMKKGATVEQARRAILMTREAGIEMSTPFMFGYHGETKDTAEETVRFIKETGLRTTRLFFSTPYPCTELYEWARGDGRIKYDEDAYLSMLGNNAERFLVNLTDMPDEEALRLKEDIERRLARSMPLKLKLKKNVLGRAHFIRARVSQLGFAGAARKAFKKVCDPT